MLVTRTTRGSFNLCDIRPRIPKLKTTTINEIQLKKNTGLDASYWLAEGLAYAMTKPSLRNTKTPPSLKLQTSPSQQQILQPRFEIKKYPGKCNDTV